MFKISTCWFPVETCEFVYVVVFAFSIALEYYTSGFIYSVCVVVFFCLMRGNVG